MHLNTKQQIGRTMKFEKVTTTPTAPYTEGAVYLVAAGKEHFEMLAVTKDKQKVRRTINTADVDERINKAISELGALEIVANIAARDALSLSANAMVLVLDASADSTVKAGGATYAYSHSDTSWTKISEAESLDLALSWANLTGKPTSTAAEIDTAARATKPDALDAALAFRRALPTKLSSVSSGSSRLSSPADSIVTP